MDCIHQLVKAHALRAPDSLAVLAPGRAPLSYGRLWAHMVDTVAALNAMGIGRNDRVAIVLPNGPELAVTLVGVIAGATAAPLNPAYQADEFDFAFSDLRVKALITRAGIESPAIACARSKDIAVIELSPTLEAEAGVAILTGDRQRTAEHGGLAEADDIALVMHTSGTTARPKIVPETQANVGARNIQGRVARGLTPGGCALNVMPLFHGHALNGTLFMSLAMGGSVVCAPGFELPAFFDWLETFRPTFVSLGPPMLQAILECAPQHKEAIARSSLRAIHCAGARLPAQTMAVAERLFDAPVIEAYGMTEAGTISTNPLPPAVRKPGSVGVVVLGEVAIVDEAGKHLAANQEGEIVVRGPAVMRGYENNPRANRVAFIDGWFRTGDWGYLDSDGYLFISGRLKEIINRGGEKVSPAEVDRVLQDHPAVAQAVTFAIPDDVLGEDVAAAVVLREGASATAREIRGFAAKRLAAFKVPRQVIVVDEIPTGSTGKVQRVGLAERFGDAISTAAEAALAEYVAPRDPLEAMLAELWSRVLGVERVGVRDDFFELGGHSLLGASLLASVEQATGQRLPVSALFNAPTVEQLAAILRQGGWSSPWSSLVPIQPGGSKRPLFCIHAVGGGVLHYRELADHLGADQPVYGLLAVGFDGREAPLTRVEDMAARYLKEIRTLQPEGPCSLCGHCLGGVVALEIAQQLLAQGQQVALLALFDAIPRGYSRPISGRRRVLSHIERVRHMGLRGKAAYLWWTAGNQVKKAERGVWRMASTLYSRLGRPMPPAMQSIEAATSLAAHRYAPRLYPGRITLFWARDDPMSFYERDPRAGWAELAAGGVEVHKVPGTHESILQEPNVQVVAAELKACLERAQEDAAGHTAER